MPKANKFIFLLFVILILIIAFFASRKIFEPKNAGKIEISGIVVPHHNLVKDRREKMFSDVKKEIKEPKTIILLSPNHFESGQALVQTTTQVWDTSEGKIQTNNYVAEQLSKVGVKNEPISFIYEHGIKLILGDIKKTFPNSEIVTLIFKRNTTFAQIQQIQKSLKKTCTDCFMVASVDFSHYQPEILANLHDNLTERYLNNLDSNALLTKAEVDSPAALALLSEWAKSHQTGKFVLKDQTNSGDIFNNPDIETTTHFFGWYESGQRTNSKESVSFIVGGTTALNSINSKNSLDTGFSSIFDSLGERLFWGTDTSVLRLTGVRDEKLLSQNLKALNYIKLNVVTLDDKTNNLEQKSLQNILKTKNIETLLEYSKTGNQGILKISGQNLSLYLINTESVPTNSDLKETIKKLKKDATNRIIILTNWKGLQDQFNLQERKLLAHSWVDFGADLIIGQDSRVSDNELYKSKPIIYSQGSFVPDVLNQEAQFGFLLAGEFNKSELKLFALPTEYKDSKIVLVKGNEKEKLLKNFYSPFNKFTKQEKVSHLLVFPQ